jgi:GNAT superfamily N-acetyltransferase
MAVAHIVPFGPEHLDAAAELLAERQVRLRAGEPGFSERFTDAAGARTLIEAAAAAEGAIGFAALDGERLAGYLVGGVRVQPPWERAAWVETAGHAVAADQPDLARDLYAAWSTRLVRGHGIFRHLVNLPARDPAALEAWYQCGFGQMHAYAVRETDGADLGPPDPSIRLRRGGPGDEEVMRATSELIWREQVSAPSWSPMFPERIEPLRADYVEELTSDDLVWIAEDAASGEALGVAISYRLDPDLDIPDDNMKLASTTTFDTARRRGVARTLLREVLRNAAEGGSGWCVTDWRTSSLTASRTWTSLGFRRTHLRLERRLDERIAWADGRE